MPPMGFKIKKIYSIGLIRQSSSADYERANCGAMVVPSAPSFLAAVLTTFNPNGKIIIYENACKNQYRIRIIAKHANLGNLHSSL